MRSNYIFALALSLVVVLALYSLYWNDWFQSTCGYHLRRSMVKELIPKAERGDIDACSRLRFHYEDAGNKERTLYWLRKGAAYGDPKAQSDLSYVLIEYKNPQYYDEAIGLLKRAASNNYPPAQSELGEMFRDGRIVNRDLKKAEEWFQKASRDGDLYSMLRYSKLLTERVSTKSDLVVAYKWLLIALSRINQKFQMAEEFRHQQAEIIEKASRLGFDVSIIKQNAILQMKTEEKITPIYEEPKPIFGDPKCQEK